jgi:hypothetical protein
VKQGPQGDGCYRANIVHGCLRGREFNRSIIHLAACCKLRFPIGLVIAVGQSLPIPAISGTTTLRCCILPGEDSSADSIPIPFVIPSLSWCTPSPHRRPPQHSPRQLLLSAPLVLPSRKHAPLSFPRRDLGCRHRSSNTRTLQLPPHRQPGLSGDYASTHAARIQ